MPNPFATLMFDVARKIHGKRDDIVESVSKAASSTGKVAAKVTNNSVDLLDLLGDDDDDDDDE